MGVELHRQWADDPARQIGPVACFQSCYGNRLRCRPFASGTADDKRGQEAFLEFIT